MTLHSPSFGNGDPIPSAYSCEGSDHSPELEWTGVPDGAITLALLCDDPDAPAGVWSHWVYFDIPATATGLPEGVASGARPGSGGVQGKNSWNRIEYGGPCPPSGIHRYFFRLYALDRSLDLDSSADRKTLLDSIEGHALAEAELMGTFTRR